MRNGKQPFLAIPLTEQGLNKKMKRKALAELNFTSKSNKHSSVDLQEALVTGFKETMARGQESAHEVKKSGKTY